MAESICFGCGLCCDGTVVTHLAVRDESDLGGPLRALGVELIVAADPPVFELPCPALDQGRCAIHGLHRPSACAQFECALSQAHLDGRITAQQAREEIATTLELRTRVEQGLARPEDFSARIEQVFRTGPSISA